MFEPTSDEEKPVTRRLFAAGPGRHRRDTPQHRVLRPVGLLLGAAALGVPALAFAGPAAASERGRPTTHGIAPRETTTPEPAAPPRDTRPDKATPRTDTASTRDPEAPESVPACSCPGDRHPPEEPTDRPDAKPAAVDGSDAPTNDPNCGGGSTETADGSNAPNKTDDPDSPNPESPNPDSRAPEPGDIEPQDTEPKNGDPEDEAPEPAATDLTTPTTATDQAADDLGAGEPGNEQTEPDTTSTPDPENEPENDGGDTQPDGPQTPTNAEAGGFDAGAPEAETSNDCACPQSSNDTQTPPGPDDKPKAPTPDQDDCSSNPADPANPTNETDTNDTATTTDSTDTTGSTSSTGSTGSTKSTKPPETDASTDTTKPGDWQTRPDRTCSPAPARTKATSQSDAKKGKTSKPKTSKAKNPKSKTPKAKTPKAKTPTKHSPHKNKPRCTELDPAKPGQVEPHAPADDTLVAPRPLTSRPKTPDDIRTDRIGG